jgi:hypothetical protein
MDIKITVTGLGLSGEGLAWAIGELLRRVRLDTDPRAHLVARESKSDAPDDDVGGDEIALAISSGGAAEKFVQNLFGFLGRHHKIEVVVEMPTGEKTSFGVDFIKRHGNVAATALTKDLTRVHKCDALPL